MGRYAATAFLFPLTLATLPFLLPGQARELCTFASIADKEARSDLADGYIRDEDDYTSNFTGALRRIINSNSRFGLTATSYMLQTDEERASGCDAAIILTRGNSSKISLFEAKLPRIGVRSWDYKQTSSGLSHFSDQLDRQAGLVDRFAVFEMFYTPHPFSRQPSWMQNQGSSCVWHDAAMAYKKSRNGQDPWSDRDLEGLLRTQNLDIASILGAIAACEQGKPLNMGGRGDAIAGEFGLRGLVLQVIAGEIETVSALADPVS